MSEPKRREESPLKPPIQRGKLRPGKGRSREGTGALGPSLEHVSSGLIHQLPGAPGRQRGRSCLGGTRTWVPSGPATPPPRPSAQAARETPAGATAAVCAAPQRAGRLPAPEQDRRTNGRCAAGEGCAGWARGAGGAGAGYGVGLTSPGWRTWPGGVRVCVTDSERERCGQCVRD